MANWNWTTPEETWFTGVVYLRGEETKHFYYGLNKTICGLEVQEFLPAEDAVTTCPECRQQPGFFEARAGELDLFKPRSSFDLTQDKTELTGAFCDLELELEFADQEDLEQYLASRSTYGAVALHDL